MTFLINTTHSFNMRIHRGAQILICIDRKIHLKSVNACIIHTVSFSIQYCLNGSQTDITHKFKQVLTRVNDLGIKGFSGLQHLFLF